MATKKHLESNKRYLAKFQNLTARVPIGAKEKIKEHAAAQQESLNQFIL